MFFTDELFPAVFTSPIEFILSTESVITIPSPIHGHIIRFLIEALNISIGFTYGYLCLTPLGLLEIVVEVQPRRG